MECLNELCRPTQVHLNCIHCPCTHVYTDQQSTYIVHVHCTTATNNKSFKFECTGSSLSGTCTYMLLTKMHVDFYCYCVMKKLNIVHCGGACALYML